MADLWGDPFDHYLNATDNYTAATGSPVTVAAAGYSGTRALRMGNNVDITRGLDAAYQTLTCGFHYRMNTAGMAAGEIVAFHDSGSQQISATLNSDGTMTFRRGASTIGSSTFSLSTLLYHHLVFKVKVDNAAGTVDYYVDGTNRFSFSGDTQATANATANAIVLSGSGSSARDFDNFYITDGTIYHALKLEARLPDADGFYSQWTPSTGVNHYALVDENPPSMSDYVSETTVGERDSYTFANTAFPGSAAIKFVVVALYANKDDAGVRQIAPFVRVAATDYDGSTHTLATNAHYYNGIWSTNPNTTIAWTQAEVDALEAGEKLVS